MVDYPIEFPYREPLMALELLIALIFIEITVYFIYKYRNNKKKFIPSVVELDWAILFFSFGITILLYIFGDFFAPTTDLRNLVLTLAYLTQTIGGILFIYHLELSRTIYTGYKLTIFTSSFLVIFIGMYLFFPSMLQTAGNSIAFFGFAIILLYFLIIIRKIWTFYKLHSMGLFIGILLWLIGYMGTTDVAFSLFGGFNIRIIGDFAMLGGIVLVAFFVNTIPSLAEIGWREKVKYVLITTNSGISIYSENFQEQVKVNEVLISGAIWGIDVFLKNIMKEANLKIIKREKDVILLEKGNEISGMLVVEQDLKLLRYLLRKLVLQFEFYYARLLYNWSGDTSLFNPTKHLIRTIFDYEKI